MQLAYAIADQKPHVSINIVDKISQLHETGITSQSRNEWVIAHYAMFRKITKQDDPIRVYWSNIIVDEAHHIKGRNAQQTIGIKALSGYRKVALTATPVEKAPHNLWSLLNWMYPNRFRGYHGFAAKYVRTEENWMGYEKVVGAKNVKRLARELEGIFIQRTKEDVRPDLPPLTEQRVPVNMNRTLLDTYRKIETAGDLLVTVFDREELITNAMAQLMLLRRLTSNGLDRPQVSDKLGWVDNYIKDNPDENILVLTVFRATAQYLAKKYKCPLVIGGGELFDPSTRSRLIVGTIKAAGQSLDLPWMDTTIFVDSEWSTIEMEQARDRIHRINITSPKQAIYLYHPNTVDDNVVFAALDNKWGTIRVVEEYLRGLEAN